MDRDEMLCGLRAFEAEGLDYVLIGAAALGIHGRIDKFRSAADMKPLPARAGSPSENFERFARHCARYHALSRRRFTPGVSRYRSVAAANADRLRLGGASAQ